ncbi:hypothetical protein [Leptospira yanagawae]|uniref:hypothetical protein n=1 Tax=Leptospira yanagawae TaxID=293069 RepID=UPI001AEF7B03|nr:hypothetical protein [Leptospira yanagawae]
MIENVFYSNTLSSIFNLTTTTSTFDSYALYGVTHNSVHIGYFTFIFILSSIFLIKKLKPDVLMYLIFAVFFFLLSLGPKISIFNFEISNLYTVLYKFFPGFKNLRVPSRIFIVSWFFLSLYITLIIPFFRIIWKKNIAVILGIFLLFELCFMSQYKEASALPIQIKKEKFPTIENGNIVFISYKNREIKLINNSFPEWYLLNSNLKTPNGYSGITLPFQYYINNLFYHHLLNDELLNYLHRFNISYIAAKIEGFQDEAFFNQTHLSASKSLQFVGKDTENHFIFFKISPTLLKVNVQSNSSRSPLNFKITNQSIPKKIEFLTDHNEKTYWQSHANGYQSEADFIELKLFNKNENTIFVKMNAGPFIEKLPYGIEMRCGDQIYDFNFPKLNSIEFVQNPLKPHSLVFPLENCLKDHLEIRVSRNTPYAILMLAELEIYEAKK